MFAFGIVISSEEQLNRWALPGIELVAGRDAVVIERRDADCIYTAYNSILEEAAGHDDLEGVVLIHQDLEMVDPDTLGKLRRRLEDPRVGIVGVVGGVGIYAMGWWFSDKSYGAYGWDWLIDPEREHLYDPGSFWAGNNERVADVEAVDGMFMALSPELVRSLPFDESLGPSFHGYDTDYCFEARKRGWHVVTEAIDVVHHNPADLPDREHFVRAHVKFGSKWGL